jgi:hypothetical protein
MVTYAPELHPINSGGSAPICIYASDSAHGLTGPEHPREDNSYRQPGDVPPALAKSAQFYWLRVKFLKWPVIVLSAAASLHVLDTTSASVPLER